MKGPITISERREQVSALKDEGLSNLQIARKLKLSPATVGRYARKPGRSPGRPRNAEIPERITFEVEPDLMKALDTYFESGTEPGATRRSLIERALRRELADPRPDGSANGDNGKKRRGK